MNLQKKQKSIFKTSKGFTLVETLLYVSIISVMLLVFSVFLFLILQSQVKFQTISEVDRQGIQVVQALTQTIRNAKKINIPVQGASGATLSVDVVEAAKTPTVFNSSGSNVQLKEGTDPIISLTASRVTVSGLSFSNVSKNNTPGIIKFQFTLNYANLSGRNEYNYSKTFYGSAALR